MEHLPICLDDFPSSKPRFILYVNFYINLHFVSFRLGDMFSGRGLVEGEPWQPCLAAGGTASVAVEPGSFGGAG